jgi:ribosome-associated translation inhibitor RaiA
MGKKKSNQSQLQRLAEVEDAISETPTQTSNKLSQRQMEDKVNRIHDIFADWPKVDIRRALEENEYDDDLVIQIHLQGGDSWQEVSKKKEKAKVYLNIYSLLNTI